MDTDASAMMVTDAATYEMQPMEGGGSGAVIRYTYSNRTSRTVSLPNCNGNVIPHVEKLVRGEWVLAWEAGRNDCLSPPITIRAGQQYRDELRPRARPAGSALGGFYVEPIPGTYRLVWSDAVWNYDAGGPPWGELIPLSARSSNRFELVVSEP